MQAQTTNLFLFNDLDDSSRTANLASGDLNALRTVTDWIKTFVGRPNKDLSRSGPICPFVQGSWERMTLWLAPEHIADSSAPDVVQLANDYKRLLLDMRPVDGDDAIYKAIVVVFTDASADRAKGYLSDARMQDLMKSSYMDDGVVIGEFHQKSEVSSVYNQNFQPFRSPVPFMLLRLAAESDWKFFLDDEDWLGIWARRFGESAVQALAAELHRTDWRQLGL
jgi:hypothetical protein